MNGRRPGPAAPLATPRLRALADRGRSRRPAAVRRPEHGGPAGEGDSPCEMCAAPIGLRHAHLVDVEKRSLLCACRPCSLLFAEPGAGGGRYRLVPRRVRRIEAFRMDELDWVALRIPVDLAFFLESSAADRVVAFYPGPMGATESQLPLDHWQRLVERNPELDGLESDVEALLVDRRDDRRDGWLVPVDVCYELVGLMRTRWKGLAGGSEAREAVRDFFADLRRRSDATRRKEPRHAGEDGIQPSRR